MADLLVDRLTPDRPPFTSVGIDCFGPFQVRRDRSLVKIFEVIFTCLVICAVHVEVVHSLETNSFLMAWRRFIARRGQVKEIRSDNGTNFTGGERELRESIKAWNHNKIHEALLQKNIKWMYNPPIWVTLRRRLGALYSHYTQDSTGIASNANHRRWKPSHSFPLK